jgi:7-keto-8-aminopelargonate synthetase-like enzyme
VDDAHGMSWTGRHGRGPGLTQLGASDRVVVAVSLSKAFGATGGALALPTPELRNRVRRCGGTLMFSGPIPPAGLGAAVAAAELHLRPEFETMQAELHDRIRFARAGLARAGLRMTTDDATPICMIQYDSPDEAMATVQGLRARGFYTCVSTFPAVPMNKPSIRFTLSRHNSFEDIAALVDQLAELTPAAAGAA